MEGISVGVVLDEMFGVLVFERVECPGFGIVLVLSYRP